MKYMKTGFLTVAVLASGIAIADCKKCHDDYILNMQACQKMDAQPRASCEARANETFESCAKGFNCK